MDYLPQKAKKVTPEERLQKQLDFEQKVKQLKNAPVEMVGDLSQPGVKDLAVDKIDKLQAAPVKKADDVMAQIAAKRAAKESAGEYVYDAGKEKAAYYAKQKAEKRAGIAGGLSAAKRAASGLGKMGGSKALAALAGPAGLALSAAQDAMASDDVGAGSDLIMEDRASLSPLSQTATDPSIANAARREMQMREQFGTGESVSNPDEGEARRRMAARFAAINALRNK